MACTIATVVSREMIIRKIFRYMHFGFKTKKFLCARTHKAHFTTHKNSTWISKNRIFSKIRFFRVCACCVHIMQHYLWENKRSISYLDICNKVWSYLTPAWLHECNKYQGALKKAYSKVRWKPACFWKKNKFKVRWKPACFWRKNHMWVCTPLMYCIIANFVSREKFVRPEMFKIKIFFVRKKN